MSVGLNIKWGYRLIDSVVCHSACGPDNDGDDDDKEDEEEENNDDEAERRECDAPWQATVLLFFLTRIIVKPS